MDEDPVPSLGGKSFEDLKMVNEHGAESGAPATFNRCSATTSGGGSRTPSRRPKPHASNRVTTATTICRRRQTGQLAVRQRTGSHRLPPVPLCLLPDRPEWRSPEAGDRPGPALLRHPDPPPGTLRRPRGGSGAVGVAEAGRGGVQEPLRSGAAGRGHEPDVRHLPRRRVQGDVRRARVGMRSRRGRASRSRSN